MTLPRRRPGAATQLWRRLLLLHQVEGSAHAEEHGDGGDGQDATDAAGKHGWITRHLGNSRCVFRVGLGQPSLHLEKEFSGSFLLFLLSEKY